MKNLTIQARLTAWYLISLSIIVGLFAFGSWYAMRSSMYHSVDRDLAYRIGSVVPFIQCHSLGTREQFEAQFTNASDSAVVGLFVQITDDRGQILYQSEVLKSHRVPLLAAGPEDGSILFSSVAERGWPVRFAARRIIVGDTAVTVHVVEPLRDMLGALRDYQMYLFVLILIALILTASAGYWISQQALRPVEQIRRDAEGIDPTDLSARLQVPATDDEVARLAQTLNAMLTRIENGFRSIEQFTADASHELGAPLALIMTAGEVSLRRERTSEELKDVLRKVIREARHMSNLVENLLDLARGDNSQRHTDLAPVDFASILREIGSEMAPIAVAKGLALSTEIPEREISVLGEPTQLRRLFLILIDNAIKYTESGSVRLRLDHVGAEVVASVADTGIGIEKDAVTHVFDRFWRADKVRSRLESGAGLGLSLAAQIAQRHGGTIAVESEIGSGTVFTVKLKPAPISSLL